MPIPLPGGRFPRFSRQPEASTTRSMHSPSADGGHGQVVGGLHERLGQVAPPHVGRVEAELLGGLVDLALHREARLGRAVPALGPARRLVGEHARALELVDRNLVGDGLQRARIEGGGHPVGAVGAAVEPGAEVHAGDRAVLLEAGLDPHQHRVAAAVDVEDLLARQRELHRPAGQLGELARARSRGRTGRACRRSRRPPAPRPRGCAPAARRGSWRAAGARSAASGSRTRA